MSGFEKIFIDNEINGDPFMLPFLKEGSLSKTKNEEMKIQVKAPTCLTDLGSYTTNYLNDVYFEDTLNPDKLRKSKTERNKINTMIGMNNSLTNVQRNTNFNKHETHSSVICGKNYSLGVSECSNRFRNESEQALSTQRSQNELFEKYSKRSSKVAIKSEVRAVVKHFTKKLIKEISYKREKELLKTNKIFQSFDHTTGISSDTLNVLEKPLSSNNESVTTTKMVTNDVLIVESNFYDGVYGDEFIDKEIQDIFQNSQSMTINLNTSTPPSVTPVSNLNPYLINSTKDIVSEKSSPKNRAIATSPIIISEKTDESMKRFSGLLNCISGQVDNGNKSRVMKQKQKSSSKSIFQRLFSKDRFDSKNSSCRQTPAYFTTAYPTLEMPQKLAIGQCSSEVNYSSTSSPTTFTDNENHSEWLEIEHSVRQGQSNKPVDSLPRTSSCLRIIRDHSNTFNQNHMPNHNGNSNLQFLDKDSCVEMTRNSGAVFIVD